MYVYVCPCPSLVIGMLIVGQRCGCQLLEQDLDMRRLCYVPAMSTYPRTKRVIKLSCTNDVGRSPTKMQQTTTFKSTKRKGEGIRRDGGWSFFHSYNSNIVSSYTNIITVLFSYIHLCSKIPTSMNTHAAMTQCVKIFSPTS